MRFFIRILINSFALYIASYFISGITLEKDIVSILEAGLILSLANALLKPLLKFLTFPLIFLTLGVFILALNMGMLWLTDYLVRGLIIANWQSLFFGTVIISFTNSVFSFLTKKKKKN